MIYNYWVAYVIPFSVEFDDRWLRPGSWLNEGTPPPPLQAATTYPLINVISSGLVDLVVSNQVGTDQFSPPPGWAIHNCYSEDTELSSQVVIREQLQELELYYPNDFLVLGAWEFGGQPIGGVGSPWFPLRPEAIDFMPGDDVIDVVLLAGQSNRQFV